MQLDGEGLWIDPGKIGADYGTFDPWLRESMHGHGGLMGEEIDARADLYAAGAVLFECVTGRPVFIAPTVTALMVKHLEEKPVDPREVQADVPAQLAGIILKALAKKREDRWQTATAFHTALEEIRIEAPPGPRVSGSTTQPI